MTKYVRYQDDHSISYGTLEGSRITPLDGPFGEFKPSTRPPIPLDAVSRSSVDIDGRPRAQSIQGKMDRLALINKYGSSFHRTAAAVADRGLVTSGDRNS